MNTLLQKKKNQSKTDLYFKGLGTKFKEVKYIECHQFVFDE
jgi:hypothetical protein